MKTLYALSKLIVLIALLTPLAASAPASTPPPRVFLLDMKRGLSPLDPALAKLKSDANKALSVAPLSVVEKSKTPPSGDKHDYMSQSRYSWPNPNTANGLPYVTRDGQVNPEIYQIPDEQNLGKMVSAVETLSLAYYFTGNEKYAAHAARLLRAWFLDPETAMNPNLNYAGYVPGVNQGSAGGVLQGRGFSRIVDSIGLLAGSSGWTEKDQAGMHEWFNTYLVWLLTSDHGKKEAQTTNNHGSWYDVQAASIALFLGKKAQATAILKESMSRRIARQIEPDGRQPLELARTKSWDYSVFNLQPLFEVAALGERAGLDIWHFQTPDGRNLKGALDYLVNHQQTWPPAPYKQTVAVDTKPMVPILRQAATKYCDLKYFNDSNTIATANGLNPRSLRENLLYQPFDLTVCSGGHTR